MEADRTLMILSSTMVADREKMFNFVMKLDSGHFAVMQSSDEAFHCVAFVGWVLPGHQGVRIGRSVLEEGPWSSVMGFTATKAKERNELASTIRDWVNANHPGKYWGIADVLLTSDAEFHCLTILIGVK